MNREVKTINILDVILAAVGTIFLVGGYFALRYGFGLDPTKIELTDAIRTLIYVLSGIFAILYVILIENTNRWTRILIGWLGQKSYNKKHKEGYPINEDAMGYKLVESNIVIMETSKKIEVTNDMDEFEDVVWYVNMELRQKAYNKLLRDYRKKLNKQYKRAKKKRLQDELDTIQLNLSINREHLQVTNDMLEAINNLRRNRVIELDTLLYEEYDITCTEHDAQVLLDNEYNGVETFIDKIRNSMTWYILTTWIFPIILGIAFIILGFTYNWNFKEVLTESDKIVLNLLVFYLVTKIPTTIYKAMVNFPRIILKPKLQSAYVFKRYNNRKANVKIDDANEDPKA